VITLSPLASASYQPYAGCVQMRRTDETPVLLVQPIMKAPFMHHCHTRHFTRIVEANFQELLWVPDIQKANEADFSASF
jgi:hypothetical protein